ncbi:uncharacterized protein LOC144088478 [Stigmatopora argus]
MGCSRPTDADSASKGALASPRDSRGFELCPRHSTDVDVDEGDWQNNATMRFFDSRRLWWECQPIKVSKAPRVRLRDANQPPLDAWLNQDAALPVCPRTPKPLRLQVHVQVIFPGCPLEDEASLNSHHLWSSHQGKTRFNNKNVHVQVIFPGCPLEDDASLA